MKYRILTMAILAGLLTAGNAMAQDDTNAPPVNDYRSFQTIASRNIFNPNRTGPRQTIIRPTTRFTRSDYFTLVGTMSYAKGQFAFFDGSSSSYSKTLNLGETIAGYKIAQITADSIKLAASSNQFIDLPVGTPMRRPEGGRWTVAGQPEPSPVASTPAPDATAPPPTDVVPGGPSRGSSPPNVPGGAESEAMKRLIQRRLTEQ